MPSLRDSGKLAGESASVRQVARQCNLSFPLSLRQFISTPGCSLSRCNTTAATPGHAIKACDPQRSFGAVIGKALDRLTDGTGLIRVLVALQ